MRRTWCFVQVGTRLEAGVEKQFTSNVLVTHYS